MENKVTQSIVAGIAGTAVITAMMLLANALGMPGIDYGKMLAEFTQTTPFVGWVMHFAMGTLLSFVLCTILGMSSRPPTLSAV